MTLKGKYKDGTIILADGAPKLPNGTMVDVFVAEPTSRGVLADLAEEFGGVATGLPTDFAAEHDHYVHGTPKRSK